MFSKAKEDIPELNLDKMDFQNSAISGSFLSAMLDVIFEKTPQLEAGDLDVFIQGTSANLKLVFDNMSLLHKVIDPVHITNSSKEYDLGIVSIPHKFNNLYDPAFSFGKRSELSPSTKIELSQINLKKIIPSGIIQFNFLKGNELPEKHITKFHFKHATLRWSILERKLWISPQCFDLNLKRRLVINNQNSKILLSKLQSYLNKGYTFPVRQQEPCFD